MLLCNSDCNSYPSYLSRGASALPVSHSYPSPSLSPAWHPLLLQELLGLCAAGWRRCQDSHAARRTVLPLLALVGGRYAADSEQHTAKLATIASPPQRLLQDHGHRLRIAELADDVILRLLAAGKLTPHSLESVLDDAVRAVKLRRAYYAGQIQRSGLPLTTVPQESFERLPSGSFDHGSFYDTILNTNCESVIG